MTDKPITTDDLYGTSEVSAPEAPVSPSAAPAAPVAYEETPEIDPSGIEETPHVHAPASLHPSAHTPGTPDLHRPAAAGTIGKILVFIMLFGLGIWLSSYVRQYLPGSLRDIAMLGIPTPTQRIPAPSDDGESPVSANGWKPYEALSGVTKSPFAGVTFQLPPEVLPPICDGTACNSQGTYLSGGTRFTVAPRGAEQGLPDFRGSAISDVGGTVFTTKKTMVAGLPATEFSGTFAGRTISGYGFSRMRGVMIEISPTQSLEVNHFTPNGIVADFESDDRIFDQILQSMSVGEVRKGSVVATPAAIPTTNASPSGSPAIAPSGY